MVPFSNWISIKISGIWLGKNRDIFLIKRYKTKTLEFFGKIFVIFDSPRVRNIFRWKKILTFFSTHQMGIGWFELGKKYWIPVPKQLEYSSTTLFSFWPLIYHIYVADVIPYCSFRKNHEKNLIMYQKNSWKHLSIFLFPFSIYRWIPSSKNWRSLPQSISRCEKTWLGPFFYRMAVLGLEVSTSNLYYSVF